MSDLKRLFGIGFAVSAYLVWWLMIRLHLWHSPVTPAQRLRHIFERLGTTFMKLGQGLSLHRDLLPDEYIRALQGLQDQVEPFPGEVARREVEDALGKPIDEVFAEFEAQPMAAASIAQVHQAVLRDGRRVIVKIRRPGIKEQTNRDMHLLRIVLRTMLILFPKLRRFEPIALVDEIWANLRREMDFRREARNILRFAEAFRGSATVHIPAAIEGLYTESVMVQELSGGKRVDDPDVRANGPQLALALVEAYLHQIFVMGSFHGDPHPGNLFIMNDGQICFHDFGIVGTLDPATRRNLGAFLLAFVYQDSEWMLDAALDLGLIAGTLDRSAFRRELRAIITDYADLPLKEWSLAEAFVRVAHIGRGRNIRIPHNLLVVMRMLYLLENAVRDLDLDFNLVQSLLDKAEVVLDSVAGSEAKTGLKRLRFEAMAGMRELPDELGAWIHGIRQNGMEMQVQHRGLEGLEQHLDRSSNRVALALVTVGLYIAASLLMQHSSGPRFEGVPVLGIAGYALALWFTWRLARGISRSGRL